MLRTVPRTPLRMYVGDELLGGRCVSLTGLDPSQPRDIRVQIGGALVRGRIVVADSRPARRWRFSLFDTRLAREWPFVRPNVTDDDGRFEMRIQPGMWLIVTEPRDGLPAGFSRVEVPASAAEVDAPIMIEPTRDIRGRVVDELGDPVSGWEVTAAPEPWELPPEVSRWAGRRVTRFDVSTYSAADGSFVLPRVANRVELDVFASHEDSESDHAHRVLAGAEGLRLKIPLGGVIIGRVRFEGTPPRRFYVRVGTREQSCDGQAGIYHVLAPRPGNVEIEIHADGFRPERRTVVVKRDFKESIVEDVALTAAPSDFGPF